MQAQEFIYRLLNNWQAPPDNRLSSAGSAPQSALAAPAGPSGGRTPQGLLPPSPSPQAPQAPQAQPEQGDERYEWVRVGRPSQSQPAQPAAQRAPAADMGAPAINAPSPQIAQAQPAQRSGGGIGDLIGGLFNPGSRGRNQTVEWLQGQGLDEGTATLMAGNKQALQKYLLDRTQGADPRDALEMEKLGLEVESMRNPTTDDVREYQFAKQEGYQGTFTDFMQEMRSAGATNVNVGPQGVDYGDPGKGLVWQRDPEGNIVMDERGAPVAIPFQGGEAWQGQQQAASAAENKEEQQTTWNAIVDQEIGRALDIMDTADLPTTGMLGDALSSIGGTAARDLRGLLDTVKANAGFDRLQAMRDASPTGGALGQVSERELAFLQSTIGNLEQSQTAGQLRFNLERLQRLYQNMLEGKRAYDGILDQGDGAGAGRPMNQDERRYLENQPLSDGTEWRDVGDGVRVRRID